jgi:hypothetical protein
MQDEKRRYMRSMLNAIPKPPLGIDRADSTYEKYSMISLSSTCKTLQKNANKIRVGEALHDV